VGFVHSRHNVDTWLFFIFQYRYATGFDWLLIIIGTLAAVASGASLPVMYILFGKLTMQFTTYGRYQRCNLNYNSCFSMGFTNINERFGPCTVFLVYSFHFQARKTVIVNRWIKSGVYTMRINPYCTASKFCWIFCEKFLSP